MKFRKVETGGEEGGSKFLKIRSGEAVRGVCRGELYEFFQVWENGKPQRVASGTKGAKPRFRINFVVKEDSKFVAKIFEFGVMINNMLHELSEDYDLSETVLKISRSGSGLETEYAVIPLKDAPPIGEIKKVELQILDHKDVIEAPQTGNAWDDVPVSEEEF